MSSTTPTRTDKVSAETRATSPPSRVRIILILVAITLAAVIVPGMLVREPAPVPQDLPTFGFIRSVDLTAGTVEVDDAEWLTGRAAADAAVEDGVVPIGTTDMSNDYYIRNLDRETVTVRIAYDATVTMSLLFEPTGMDQVPIDLATFARVWTDQAPTEHRYAREAPYHLTYRNGLVTAITEQYVP